MSKPRSQTAENSIGYDSSKMKGRMVQDPFTPESRRFGDSLLFRGANMNGISHHQRAAHSQAVKASHKTDQERSNKIKNHKLKIFIYEDL